VIDLTPPARGKADTAAKRLGERAVLRDVDAIFEALDPNEWTGFYDDEGKLRLVPTTQNGQRHGRRGATVVDYIHFLERSQMFAFHQKMRTRSNGGVQRIQRDNLIGRKKTDSNHTAFVTKDDLAWYNKEAIKTVGKLAAGWLKGATELGYRPPEWISRHGEQHGEFAVSINGEEMIIIIGNDVPFAGRVKGLARSVQQAMDWTARGMENRVASAQQRAAAAAGLAPA
jgi:hypothetical protein